MKNNFLFTIILGLFIISSVSALGISPGRTTIDFEPSLQKEVEFKVINSGGEAIDIAFAVEGELAEYVTLSNKVESFNSGETEKKFKYGLNLPPTLGPGLHKANVVALQLPEGSTEADTIITATVSVVTQIYVYVPYPGKYVESVFEIVSIEESNTLEFHVPFVSRGEEQIQKISATVEVFDGEESVVVLNTNSLSVNSKERKELFVNWNPEVTPGGYKAVVTIDFDGEKIVHEKEFVVGPEEIGLLGISVNDFKLGDVAKVRILVQNRLKESLSGVFANMDIDTPEFENVANLKSETYEIPGESNKELVVYWDTEEVEKGLYHAELGLHENENVINKNFRVDVQDEAISFTGVGFVVAGDNVGKMSTTTILMIVIGILVLINLLWVVIWLKNKNKKK